MNLSAPFIARPVATTLLTIGIALAGLVAFLKLPVSPLPRVDFPTIQVSASLPGASPETLGSMLAPISAAFEYVVVKLGRYSSSGPGQFVS